MKRIRKACGAPSVFAASRSAKQKHSINDCYRCLKSGVSTRAPRDKCLALTFQTSPTQKIREGESRVPLPFARHENQRGQSRLRFLEADVHLPAEASMPAQRGG
jgi:hypothetical protein